jgi:CRISPR-associated protein Csb2
MDRHFLLEVRLYADGMGTARYHGMSQGAPEWPPAPARIFQALVAGVARGHWLPPGFVAAMEWLEQLPPPLIAAPLRRVGQAVSLYVPNNDADALSDPSDVSGIRTSKQIQPSLFDGAQPILYVWEFPESTPHEHTLVDAAHSLYQMGRSVDNAWADAHVVDGESLQRELARYRGVIYRPTPSAVGHKLLFCPAPKSMASLIQRHRAVRLRLDGLNSKPRLLFTNSPKPRFFAVNYAPQLRRLLYDVRERGTTKAWPWLPHRAVSLIERIRNAAVTRLRLALGEVAFTNIDRCFVGKAAEGTGSVSPADRIRIVPLPSIGALHADQAIRRILVEVPGGCSLSFEDLDWAFSGLDCIDADTGESSPWVLIKAANRDMLDRYSESSRQWQSVTAVALPVDTHRRSIDPDSRRVAAKRVGERLADESRAIAAVKLALRHSGLVGSALQVQVQREPFVGRGWRAAAFAEGTRFQRERLWHVAIGFDRLVSGPLVIGDGRFLGLGVLAPAGEVTAANAHPGERLGVDSDGIFAFWQEANGVAAPDEPVVLARALRRAVMARVRDSLGLPTEAGLHRYFSGHAVGSEAPDGGLARHLAFHWDSPRRRWLVVAPHRLERRYPTQTERIHLKTLDYALDGLVFLLAGKAGRFALQRTVLPLDDALLAPAREWESVTPYVVTRHRRRSSANEALIADVLAECRRCNLPLPNVTVLAMQSIPGQGLQARLRLHFGMAIHGPIGLGRSSLLGGGLFVAVR